MNRYKRYLPIVALVLIGLGVNLDQFGIDLERLAGSGSNDSPGEIRNQAPSSDTDTIVAGEATFPVDKADGKAGSSATAPVGWSDTTPNINLAHVFHGEINRSGKPVGFHARPGGQDPPGARVARVRDRPNALGVYTAQVEIRDGSRWQGKFSSMFPDTLSAAEVVDVVLSAYHNAENPNAQPWEGPSGLGFRIQGYTSSRGGINTAFPVFVRNP